MIQHKKFLSSHFLLKLLIFLQKSVHQSYKARLFSGNKFKVFENSKHRSQNLLPNITI